MEGLSLIDVSSEDDLLLFPSTPEGLIDPTSSMGTSEIKVNKDRSQVDVADEKQGNSPLSSKQMELILHLSESPERKQAKSAKFNLRKSLAWDNAFLTSEGVLDPEELAVVNSTFRKVQASALPVIPEDARKSVESTSTLDNDTWDLENLEVDLFENVRASIQKSLGNSVKASKIAHPGTRIAPQKMDVSLVEAAEKIESSSPNKKKPNLEVDLFENVRASIQRSPRNSGKASKIARPGTRIFSQKIDVQSVEAAEKIESSYHNKKKPNLASEKTSNHQRSQLSIRDSHSTLKIGNQGNACSKTVLKPSRLSSTASLPTIPSREGKSTVLGSIQMLTNNAKPTPGDAGTQKPVKVTNTSNGIPSSRNTRSLLLRSTSTLPGSSQNSLRKSSDSASNAKLPVTKKIGTPKNVQHLSSGSTNSKIPVKATRTSGISKKESSPNMLPSSTMKLYSAVSPSSSFDSMASEASSSASSTSKLSRDYSDAGSSSSSASLVGPNRYLVNTMGIPRARNGNLPPVNHLQSRLPTKASQGELLASDKARSDHIKVYSNNTAGGKCFKPSGLRMPTPKIGYFDPEKNKIGGVEKLPRPSQQNNFLKVTNGANAPNDSIKVVAPGTTKSMTTSKLKSDELQISTPSSNDMVSSNSPAIDTELVSASSMEPTLVEELSESSKSHSSPNITESHRELTSSVVKGSSSTKEASSESKSSRYTGALGDKGEHDELQNLQANQDAADWHKDCTISGPRKIETGFVMDKTCDSVRKCSENVDVQRTDTESDSLVITTGKENIFPVENSWPQQNLS